MSEDDGVERSAMLLMSLGEEVAVEVFKFLGPREVQQLGAKMSVMTSLNRDTTREVLQQFRAEMEQKGGLTIDSDQYLRSVLTRALGNEKGSVMIERILEGEDNSGIESLKWMEPLSVADMIRNEHPQIIATILVHLESDQASEILKLFPERLRNDVMLRIATLEGVQPTALKELNIALTQLLTGRVSTKRSAMGGVKVAANILNYLGGTMEGAVVGSIKDFDADLAQQIQDEMFVFEDLLALDDRAIQTVMREVQNDSLILALKGTTQDMRNKIFKNMSQRAAESLKEDLESKGPVKLSDVEREQKEILKIVRRLADEGQIILGGKGGDEGMVS
ncbi:MAG: flagellar motor switch protein FliG [Pseudomonadota bacterium]